ncbi:S9 family peptidase [Tuwongella immobilis]|uniref:Peptidase S9 prolyl oligopeptidase catalytic domain-containing protein n=1 Tax=Tuwongella immobilis TaxID=692036 RepID=A0A6C2YGU1_9BACT|nr:prolyl oligopeptidase family serine peptidase [Tuwongella immobilis]VIP00574.1 peptidase s9 : Dipeptidyl aminopeptidase/acylaminoacyl peptidase OS=Singulisphaera acidiphila (strain ATCC BAA-1392 / DSM 18658 / VKM B-2454 / MOB10) GN=Sinac_6999 PE=4 SV=1: DPPIV_N: Peptidase_S9 [Tuwongella immobilis]VTR96566.1 peptidase s9 : Dipeptidyl aminopeptidase/acylaminoacyl peptidase OS=Singulisphaera acidiphila (strain ATCC BAA-1392 / DSM 18658 / VKM B-2454 / MOB10) GN=Sinac_6999 PE=4 SV=1: DPPIV_N: Pepti
MRNRCSPVRLSIAGLLLIACSSGWAWGQGSRADYDRAEKLGGLFAGKVRNERIEPRWSEDRAFVFYRRETSPNEREYVLIDLNNGQRAPMFDAEKLAAALAKELKQAVSPKQLPIGNTVLHSGNDVLSFDANGKRLGWNRQSNELLTGDKVPKVAAEPNDPQPVAGGRRGGNRPPRARTEPPAKRDWVPFLKDHNVWVREVKSGMIFPMTKDGTEKSPYQGDFRISPNGQKVVCTKLTRGLNRQIPLVESSPKDSIHSKLIMLPYVKPGDEIDTFQPFLFDLTKQQAIAIASRELFDRPWSISDIEWESDSSRFLFLYNQRGHQVMRWIAVDATSGAAKAIIDEKTSTFIDWTRKVYRAKIADTNDLIWMSERSGWNHLYRIDGQTGAVKNPITKGEWVVRDVVRVTGQGNDTELLLKVGGIQPGEDPYHIHFIRVKVDGTGLTRLTDGDGTHDIQFSPDGKTYIDRYSRVDLAPITEIRRTADGKKIAELERADDRALVAAGWQRPERFVSMGRDDKTPIYGIIFRPMKFDPKKKYPIVEDIYAGPHDSHTPKEFRSHYGMQSVAELGFIVVKMDGMGTSNRSKAFHDVCWKNLGDSGFPDRIRWMKAAAAKYPYLDTSRVGVFGTSAGGQSALRALLAHPDFYKVAVSDCGCHDNRVDKIWWNEQWMGYPVGPHYAEQSNVTQAHKLEGKLMLMVGELDKNVDPASTYQVVDALIKANKDFDLIVFPGAGHGSGSPYAQRRRRDFLVRHLLNVEPRWESKQSPSKAAAPKTTAAPKSAKPR